MRGVWVEGNVGKKGVSGYGEKRIGDGGGFGGEG